MANKSANQLTADQCVGETIDGRYRLTASVDDSRALLFRAECLSEQTRPTSNPFLGNGSPVAHSDTVLVELAGLADTAKQFELLDDTIRNRTRIAHPHIMKWRDVGTIKSGGLAGAAFLVTESCGESLSEIVVGGGLSEYRQVRSLVQCMGEALVCLHARGDLLGPVTSSDLFWDETGWKLRPSLSGLCERLYGAGPEWQASDDIREVGLLLQQYIGDRSGDLQAVIHRCHSENPDDRPSAVEMALACMEAPSVTKAALLSSAGGFEICWKPPARGHVRVMRPANGRVFQTGTVLLTSQLDELGELLISDNDRSIHINRVDREEHVIILTVDGPAATVGAQIRLSGIPDVSGLSARRGGDKLSLSWRWPHGLAEAVVSCRGDRFPVHPHENGAQYRRVTRTRYSAEGVRLGIPACQDQLYVAVFSAECTRRETKYSSAATQGAQLHVPLRLCRTIRYEIVRDAEAVDTTGNVFQLRLLAERQTELPELLLVAKVEGTPTSPEDGTCLHRNPHGTFCSAEALSTVTFTVPENYRDTAWTARLFPADAELGRWLTLAPKMRKKSRRILC